MDRGRPGMGRARAISGPRSLPCTSRSRTNVDGAAPGRRAGGGVNATLRIDATGAKGGEPSPGPFRLRARLGADLPHGGDLRPQDAKRTGNAGPVFINDLKVVPLAGIPGSHSCSKSLI